MPKTRSGPSRITDGLLRLYWPALKAHLVYKKRIHANDADDLVQAFIENKVLERNLVGGADQSRGRFRNLLLTALDNFVANQRRRLSAKKRTADRAQAVDPVEQVDWSDGSLPPDKAFEVNWARQLLDEVVKRMKAECEKSGRDDLWGIFEGRILLPIFEAKEPLGYGQEVRDSR